MSWLHITVSNLRSRAMRLLLTKTGLAGSSLAFDLLIIALPFPILRRLTFDRRKKFALALVFGLGFFVTITQVVRILKISALVNYTDSRGLIIWSITEINFGILVACIPSFAPLLASVGHRVDQALSASGLGASIETGSSYAYKSSSSKTDKKSRRTSRVPDLVSATEGEDLKLRPRRTGANQSWVQANAASTESIDLHYGTARGVCSEEDGLALPPLDDANAHRSPQEIYVTQKVKIVRDPYCEG